MIFNEHGGSTEHFIAADGAGDVFRVAVAVIHIHEDRQICRVKNPRDRCALFAVVREIDIGISVDGTLDGKAANLECFESRAFDELGGERVVGDGKLQVAFLAEDLFPRGTSGFFGHGKLLCNLRRRDLSKG